jgi:23S rRNA (uracil1939-C5)-methyltransferase
VVEGVLAPAIPRIVYVSCDVATLARDSRAIVAGGYRVVTTEAFDMFPNTPHVEVVVVFERR